MKNYTDRILFNMINYFGQDARRVNHALKVYSFSKNIGVLEDLSKDKLLVLEAAAILHDIGIKVSEQKYKSSSGKYQEIEGPGVALELLKEFDIEKEALDRICYLIGNHHTYSKIDDIDFQILIEADFLVNIYEDNIEKEQIKSISEKYFKTETGKKYISSLYL